MFTQCQILYVTESKDLSVQKATVSITTTTNTISAQAKNQHQQIKDAN